MERGMQAEQRSGATARTDDIGVVAEDAEAYRSNALPISDSPDHDSARPEESVVIDIRSGEPAVDLVSTSQQGLLGASQVQLGLKRALDIVGSTLGMILLAPIYFLVAVTVKLSSPGPVFYVSDRVGKDGRIFRFVKFRTMYVEAENTKIDLVQLNDVDGPVFKMKDDPRITQVGRFLRKSSLDELPQLFHVLTGEMSLVGPRPPIPDEVESYSDRHLQRLTVKPGLTCLWQVSGRSTLDFETWVDLDLEYIQNWSIGYDLRLLVRTVPAVVTGRGAF